MEDESINEFKIEDKSSSVQNPNKNDPRRLFLVHKEMNWNPDTPYEQIPNRLEHEGPVPLLFPDHFYEVQGGVVVIYWEDNRSIGCTCTIKDVDEVDMSFKYQIFS